MKGKLILPTNPITDYQMSLTLWCKISFKKRVLRFNVYSTIIVLFQFIDKQTLKLNKAQHFENGEFDEKIL